MRIDRHLPRGSDPHRGSPEHGLPVVAVVADGFCYGPLSDHLDTSDLAASDGPQRWSDAGARTIYLASDAGVALAEWGRHVPLVGRREPSGLWRVPVGLRRAIDLREPGPGLLTALAEAGVSDVPDIAERGWCLDAGRTRDLASWLRYATGADGLLVPSVAFLDDPARGNIVVFLADDQPASSAVGEPERIAVVHWTDGEPAVARIDTRVQVTATQALGRM